MKEHRRALDAPWLAAEVGHQRPTSNFQRPAVQPSMPSPIQEILATLRQFSAAESATPAGSAETPATGVLPLLAAYGALAPSSYNTQPWEFRATAHGLDVCLDASRGSPVGDAQREPVISCGAALFNIRVALRHFGYRDIVLVFPDADPQHIAHIEAGRSVHESEYNRALFHAMAHRHTIRARRDAFEQRPVPAEIIRELTGAARASGAWLQIVTAPADQCALADLVFEAGEKYEAAAGHLTSEDGFDTAADVAMIADADRVAHAISVAEARRASRTLREAPVVAVLGTDGDDPGEWVTAGEALEHVLLRAATHGIFATYANQPLRVAPLRPWVRAVAGHPGEAHVLLGLGFSHPPHGPPRRPVADVLG